MITFEEYEKAQQIVWDYEDQLKKQNKSFDITEKYPSDEFVEIRECGRCEYSKELGFCPKCDTSCYSY